MTPEQGAWTVVAVFITGVFSFLVARAKSRADEKTKTASLEASVSDSTWERAQEWLNRLEGEVKELRAENRKITAKHEELWEENRLLHQENRDQQQLIKEVAEYILQTDAWIAQGSPPPPPTKPQRIAQHVEQIRQKYSH
ncbi:hypothetical protein [Nesterenkonia haasae]|uniref:hypothetical protein n=1 Tax=Nesterenkonia haasae TaxID=2587813 RepID=UPI0013919681|nr:hypothetical protein [Nesterenkonia haasae]NDK31172.1 hypothetical protein [Nesterenkonia haasae]